MSDKEIEAIVEMLLEQQTQTPADQSIEDQRAGFEASGAAMPLPQEPHDISKLCLGTVAAIKVSPHHAPAEQAILYFHGGGYVFGSCSSYQHLVARLAVDSQKICYGLDYRLAPENPFPAALDDALAAYEYLIEQQKIDASNIVLAGDSAGGGLAVALLLSLKQRSIPLPAGSVLFSPWVDLSIKTSSEVSGPEKDPMVTQEHLNALSMLYVGAANPTNQLISPINADCRGLPPIYVQAGENELLRNDSVELVQTALDCGVEAELDIYPDLFHVFQYFWPLLGEGAEAIQKAASRVQKMLS